MIFKLIILLTVAAWVLIATVQWVNAVFSDESEDDKEYQQVVRPQLELVRELSHKEKSNDQSHNPR